MGKTELGQAIERHPLPLSGSLWPPWAVSEAIFHQLKKEKGEESAELTGRAGRLPCQIQVFQKHEKDMPACGQKEAGPATGRFQGAAGPEMRTMKMVQASVLRGILGRAELGLLLLPSQTASGQPLPGREETVRSEDLGRGWGRYQLGRNRNKGQQSHFTPHITGKEQDMERGDSLVCGLGRGAFSFQEGRIEIFEAVKQSCFPAGCRRWKSRSTGKNGMAVCQFPTAIRIPAKVDRRFLFSSFVSGGQSCDSRFYTLPGFMGLAQEACLAVGFLIPYREQRGNTKLDKYPAAHGESEKQQFSMELTLFKCCPIITISCFPF